MAEKPRIVIIGAGMAGLTAANKLYTSSNDMFELCVIEGGCRLGGRINTSEFCGGRIEMGATWIHGIKGSPIYKIAQETDSLVSDEPWECMDSAIDEPRTFSEGGFELEPSILEPISNLFTNLMGFAQGKGFDGDCDDSGCADIYEIATRVSSCNGSGEKSLGSFLKLGFDAYWDSIKDQEELKRYGNWSRRSLAEAVFAMHSNTQRTYTSADNLYSLDFDAESEYQMFPGEEITIAKGYKSVINHLASVLPPGLIQLNRKVTKIEWRKPKEGEERSKTDRNGFRDDSRPVKIHFSDGSFLVADHVIVTISLGVLKAETAQENGMFSPPLPDFKIDAIRRLGYGVVNKLFVETTQKNFPSLQLVFRDADSEFRQKNVPWWMRRTATMTPIHSNSRVLLSWFAGKEAHELESLTDDEIIHGVSAAVSCLTGKEMNKQAKPSNSLNNGCPNDEVRFTRVLRSKWGSDPLFLGSYSYIAVGSSGDDIDTMAEPLPQIKNGDLDEIRVQSKIKNGDLNGIRDQVQPFQILFAGEATHRTHYSTTHGAYFSGLREANRLLVYHKCAGY